LLYLSGVVRPDLPAMVIPRMGQRPPEGQPWAADNGRFSAPQDYTDEKYLAWLAKMPAESCLFATAPDVVGDAAATLALSEPMFDRIRAAGYRMDSRRSPFRGIGSTSCSSAGRPTGSSARRRPPSPERPRPAASGSTWAG
jgi:hypothetical protein